MKIYSVITNGDTEPYISIGPFGAVWSGDDYHEKYDLYLDLYNCPKKYKDVTLMTPQEFVEDIEVMSKI